MFSYTVNTETDSEGHGISLRQPHKASNKLIKTGELLIHYSAVTIEVAFLSIQNLYKRLVVKTKSQFRRVDNTIQTLEICKRRRDSDCGSRGFEHAPVRISQSSRPRFKARTHQLKC